MKSNHSVLSTFNPSVKLVTHLVAMFILMGISDVKATLFIWLVAVGIGFIIGGWHLNYVLKRLSPYIGLFVLVLWMMAAFGKGENVIWQWAWFRVTHESLTHGLTIGLRMLCFVTFGLLFTSTTDLTEFIMSLIHQCKLQPKWAYGLLAGFRFLPLFQHEMNQMKKAHKIRGYNDKKGWNAFVSYAFPLFVQGIRKSERIAMAMEARRFNGTRKRTYYQRPVIHFKDYIYFISILLIVLAIAFL